MTDPPKGDAPDPCAGPAYLLATLFAARKSGDAGLARLTADRLAALGIRVRFASDLAAAVRKAVARG